MQDQKAAESARRIDAAEANRLAQELNDRALGVDTSSNEIETANRTEGELVGSTPGVFQDRIGGGTPGKEIFPPNIDANATFGGDPEGQGVLREEESR
jgi:hypothetical protein